MRLYQITSSFTRPNDAIAYAVSDMVANSTNPGDVVPLTWNVPQGFLLTAVSMSKSNTANHPQFLLYLYQFKPTHPAGDNTAYITDLSGYLGSVFIDMNPSPRFNDFCYGFGPVDPNLIPLFTDTVQANQGNVYGLLQTTSGFATIANETFTVNLIGVD